MNSSPIAVQINTNRVTVDESRGLILGALGVIGFSLTLPMTRIAVAELDPVFVGLGRALIAALLSAIMLRKQRSPLPARRHLTSLLIVTLGVIIGFPLFTSLAMQHLPASHGAIVLGLLPLATALFAVLRAHERPSPTFWIAAAIGSTAVVLFALANSGWDFRAADGLLLVAVILCGLGYAEGGKLARELGGAQVIAWALLLASPILAIPVAYVAFHHNMHASFRAWAAFGYTGVVSMFLGFIAWYQGLAVGGVARVSQMQLLQVFITLGWAWLLLDERITPLTLVTAVVVVTTVAMGRRATIARSKT
jgi:drug/metabolite transporter (DMT)-like permease